MTARTSPPLTHKGSYSGFLGWWPSGFSRHEWPPAESVESVSAYSTRSFAFASSTVCHCMFAGVSGPPRFRAITWSMM